MTIAQRITQVRKEQNLSQEAFGEALGVSRQAISKWESGVSLPEVEKLIAVCRTFHVRMEWLLCMDDEKEQPSDAGRSGDLTEEQLQMVEEIVARYLESIPKPKRMSRKAKFWLAAAGAAAVIAALVSFARFSDKLDRLQNDNSYLQSSVQNIQINMSGQIDYMTERMEEILESQNALTADYGHTVKSIDLTAGTATLTPYAVPKQYVEGMTAKFVAESSGEIVEVQAAAGSGQTFQAELTCPLSDLIRLSVVFDDGQSLQTQYIGEEYGLQSSTQPEFWCDFGWHFWGEAVVDGKFTLSEEPVFLELHPPIDERFSVDVRPVSATVGVYVNDELAASVEIPDPYYQEDPPGNGGQESGVEIYPDVYFPETVLALRPGDTLTIAAHLTDSYGRTFSRISQRYEVSSDNTLEMADYSDDGTYGLS